LWWIGVIVSFSDRVIAATWAFVILELVGRSRRSKLITKWRVESPTCVALTGGSRVTSSTALLVLPAEFREKRTAVQTQGDALLVCAADECERVQSISLDAEHGHVVDARRLRNVSDGTRADGPRGALLSRGLVFVKWSRIGVRTGIVDCVNFARQVVIQLAASDELGSPSWGWTPGFRSGAR
jgi:hypothetical protein